MSFPYANRDGLYRILDEPRPGKLSHIAVRPLWPLLAIMFCGMWLSWPWFVLNSLAVGSPTRRKEWTWVAVGFAGLILLFAGLTYAANSPAVISMLGTPDNWIAYALLPFSIWKLFISFKIYFLQSRSLEIYIYYGGIVRNGVLLLLIGFAIGAVAMPMFVPHQYLLILH